MLEESWYDEGGGDIHGQASLGASPASRPWAPVPFPMPSPGFASEPSAARWLRFGVPGVAPGSVPIGFASTPRASQWPTFRPPPCSASVRMRQSATTVPPPPWARLFLRQMEDDD